MKLGQLIEYNKRNIFLQKLCRKWTERLVSDLFLFLKKALYGVKESGLKLSFNMFHIALNLAYNKNKLYKILDN